VVYKILSQIEENINNLCECIDTTNMCFCYVKEYDYYQFQPLIIELGQGLIFEVPVENYVKFSEISGEKIALLMIIAQKNPSYIGLGTAFLKNYYLVLNSENNQVSLGILKN